MILVLGKAMSILELLAKRPNREVALGEIAETLNMDRGTCANIIKTLASRGYVQQTGPRQGYKLGYMVYDLTNADVNNDDLTKIAREDITKLGEKVNECAILSVIRNDKRVVLLRSTPDRNVQVRTNIDKSVYSANSGRVILANYTQEHLDKFIIRKGLPSPDEWPEIYKSNRPAGEMMNELSEIRRKGYAIQVDKHSEVTGFAAPIFRDGHIAGSVCVYVPCFRLEDNANAILGEVLDCAKEINRKIALTDRI